MPFPTDPISAAFAAIPFILTTADQIGQLIARLQDHQRGLAEAESDRAAGDDRFDADLAAK